MKIGTIGAGRIAKAFTKHVAKAGFEIVMSNHSGPASLLTITEAFGPHVKAGTLEEAVQADIVLLSVPWSEVPNVLSQVKSWNGQIILDTTNAISFPEFTPLALGDKTSSEIVAELAPGARVVKAFNTLEAATLAAEPREGGGKRVIFISGNDAAAKATVLKLLDKMGFAGLDLGALASGGKIQQFGGPLSGQNLLRLPS